jgi:pantothenate kinase
VSPGLARLRAADNSLVDRARVMSRSGGRVLLGITGPPASGKSTLAVRVAAAVGDTAVVVPMDGYHLHDDELARLGLSDRKGAPETFDVAGYAALLRRLRSETDHAVYAPEFDRSREESVAGAIGVHPWHRLVITEGNYLLLDSPGWTGVLPLLDETWYVEVDDDLRRGAARGAAHRQRPLRRRRAAVDQRVGPGQRRDRGAHPQGRRHPRGHRLRTGTRFPMEGT